MLQRMFVKSVVACLSLVVMGGLLSCTGKKEPQQSEIAARTAKIYYNHLLKGEYEQFLEGRFSPQNTPASYCKQMIEVYKTFVSRQDSLHKGIDSVTINDAKYSAKHKTANVFLTLHFGDATHEEVLVPMILKQGTWYMR